MSVPKRGDARTRVLAATKAGFPQPTCTHLPTHSTDAGPPQSLLWLCPQMPAGPAWGTSLSRRKVAVLNCCKEHKFQLYGVPRVRGSRRLGPQPGHQRVMEMTAVLEV